MNKYKKGINPLTLLSYQLHSKSQLFEIPQDDDYLNSQLPTLPTSKRSYFSTPLGKKFKKTINCKQTRNVSKGNQGSISKINKNKLKQLIILDQAEINGNSCSYNILDRYKKKEKTLKTLSSEKKKSIVIQQIQKINKSQQFDRYQQQKNNRFIRMFFKKMNRNQSPILSQGNQSTVYINIQKIETQLQQRDNSTQQKQVRLPKFNYKKTKFNRYQYKKQSFPQNIPTNQSLSQDSNIHLLKKNTTFHQNKIKAKINQTKIEQQMIGSRLGPWKSDSNN